jgi:hypothetical protein
MTTNPFNLPTTAPQLKRVRERALAELGIDPDHLSPHLRKSSFCNPKKGDGGKPGIVNCSQRQWETLVAEGVLPPGTRWSNGVVTWPRMLIVTIALDGLPERMCGRHRTIAARRANNLPSVRRARERVNDTPAALNSQPP